MNIENEYGLIVKTLSNDGGHIKINKKLVQILGLEASCVYSELLNMQIDAIKKDEWQLINNLPCISVTTECLSALFGISAHKQRAILQQLQAKNLIYVYYGSGNSRMIYISSDYYYLNELLNPVKGYKEVIFERFTDSVNNLKKILFNMEFNQQEKISDIKDEYIDFISKQTGDYNYIFENKIFDILENKDIKEDLQKERSKMCV